MPLERYLNRELSWLEFNARVLDEALERSTPLLERLKFLSIVASNFDEYFMVRVAAVKALIRAGETALDPSGLGPSELLTLISRRCHGILERQYACLAELLPALEREGLAIVPPGGWTPSERRWLESFFNDRVLPLLTPLRVEDEAVEAEFPSTGNLRLHAAFLVDEDGKETGGETPRRGKVAVVQVPPNIDRFVRMPAQGSSLRYALVDEIVAAFGHRLFPGWKIREVLLFKVTRDADFGVDEERDEDFIAAMEEVLAGRQNSFAVRLSYSGESPTLAERLRLMLRLDEEDLYALPGPVDLRGFLELASSDFLPAEVSARLRDEPWPSVHSLDAIEGTSIWTEIAKRDLLLHLPYESFDPVVRFLDEAADDPSVLAIKMTLYRTSGNSPVVRALTRAARNGKQVAVLVELKARFDEEKNIAWASRLEQAGAIVIYGIARLKVHAKAALVLRREDDGSIRRYLHLSTGNYNDRTARLYADISMFTADEDLCREASVFFNMITGYSAVQELRKLAVAPFDLKSRLISMIEREAQRSTAESPGLIMAKINALADTDVIDALYAASAAGVRIQLNVRGICTLIPGVPGMSENISVVSVVGRYLEHARIIFFRNGGAEEFYLSSADWLARNLERRIELMFPVLNEELRGRVREILSAYFQDNSKSHRMNPDGSWTRLHPTPGEKAFSAQAAFYAAVKRRKALDEAPLEDLQVRRRPSV
ncbi:MAG TPA: polyphosphate kinase 1 [Rectinemataceae bacterium]|nr:polyphosphate kinase 1 [Rectinemataceae bacterium]